MARAPSPMQKAVMTDHHFFISSAMSPCQFSVLDQHRLLSYRIMMARLFVFAWLSLATALRLIESNSLDTCMQNSQLIATSFNAVFTPNNQSLAFHLEGNSQISADVVLDL